MIKWLHRVDPDRPFLKTAERVWTYGETTAEVQRRLDPSLVTLPPGLDATSVFDCLGGVFGGGAMVVGPGVEAAVVSDAVDAKLVVFTSGTSGEPKGVRLTSDNLEAASAASMEHLGHDQSDTWLLAMPLHHVGGLSILVRSAYAGGSVRLLPGFDPVSFAAALHDDVTMVSVVAAMLQRLLDHDPGPYRGLRAVLVGGGPIPGGLLEKAASAGLPVLPSYGMTETFGQVATLKPGSPLSYRAHPLPGVDLRIESDSRIAVRGRQVSPGYLGEPDRADHWFLTSDLGEIDPEGAIRVTGRADTMIVTGGENVDPFRVEAELKTHPAVGDVVVIGVPDSRWGMAVACLYVGEIEESEVVSWLEDRLPGFMVPKTWKRVEAIPTTTLGKPDRSAGWALLEG